jgi:RAT1-interacting protein
MCKDGFECIANIDISSVVIEQMSKRYDDVPNMTWHQMNVCALDFSDETFAAIIDKGTIDCVLCGEHAVVATSTMLSEAWRVLKPKGHYIGISYGAPDCRLPLFAQEDCTWRVAHYSVPKPINAMPAGSDNADDNDDDEGCHYVYVCQKIGG